jgi:methylmalonyl-CoA mutase
MGGMTKAIESGMAKLRIEEAATKKQARIDSKEETLVGVNKYVLEKPEHVKVLAIDNTAVRNSQCARLNLTKAARNNEEVQKALNELTTAAACVKTGQSAPNLLDLAVKAARCRATLGEISAALEKEWGRHVASTQVVQGAYSASFNKTSNDDEAEYQAVLKEVRLRVKWCVDVFNIRSLSGD